MHLSSIPLGAFVLVNLLPSAMATPKFSLPLLARTHALIARQTDCATACQDTANTVQACTTTACLCTSQNSQLFQACINCASTSTDPTALSDAEEVASGYNNQCGSTSVPALTVDTSAFATGGAGGAPATLTSGGGAPLPNPTGGVSTGGSTGGNLPPNGAPGTPSTNNSPNSPPESQNPPNGASGANTPPNSPPGAVAPQVPGAKSAAFSAAVAPTLQVISLAIVGGGYFTL